MLVVGCDPGATGAVALVDTDALRVLDVLDMPVIRSGKLVWVDGAVLGDWLEERQPSLAILELVQTWPGDQAPARTARMCRLAGGVETLLSSFGVPTLHVAASAWKRRAGLLKQPKSASLSLAAARLSWPQGTLYLAKHEARAEAALIGLFGRAPAAPPKPPRRSKIVDAAAAACVPPGPLFGRPV